MAYDRIKKNVYYDPPSEYPHSSRNHDEDFKDFHLPLHRMHHASVHDRGIAAGLEVSGAPGAPALTIAAGVAIDGAGELIVLAAGGHGDIGADPPNGSNNEVPVPVSLPLGSMSNKTVYLTIQYAQILRPAEGSGGREEQVPWLRLQPTSGAGAYVDDGSSVILAIAVIDAAGNLVLLKDSDPTLPFHRALVGLPASELRVRRSHNNANQLQDTVSGKLKASAGGGLHLSVPNAGDSVLLAQDSGANCAGLELRANQVVCKDGAGRDVVHIDAAHASLRIGAQGNEGDLIVLDQNGRIGLGFDGSHCRLDVGTTNNPGHLYMRDANAAITMSLDGAASAVNANHLNPYDRSTAIDVGAQYFRIHGSDLVLDGRSGGNKRALVDAGKRLVVNYNTDYSDGVNIGRLHLAEHIHLVYWEGVDTSKRPTYNQWIVLFEVPTGLPASEWDQVSMCEIGMFDNGSVDDFWWGAQNTSFIDGAGNWVVQWKVNYRDDGDDWRPWLWNVMMIAVRI